MNSIRLGDTSAGLVIYSSTDALFGRFIDSRYVRKNWKNGKVDRGAKW